MQLSVKDAARLLGVSEKTVYRWARRGMVPFTRVSSRYRFGRSELLDWATGQRIAVAPDILREPPAAPLPTLAAALEAGGIFYRVAGDDVPGVLRQLVNHLRLPDRADREYVYRSLLAREELAPTAVGGGVALPHARNPLGLFLQHPSVTLCFLETPVDFGALDGGRVHTLFAVLSPTLRGHLHLLARIAHCLRNRSVRQCLAAPDGRAAVLRAVAAAEAGLAGVGAVP